MENIKGEVNEDMTEKIIKFEDRHCELERRIIPKTNVEEHQEKSAHKEVESKNAEELCQKVTFKITEKNSK